VAEGLLAVFPSPAAGEQGRVVLAQAPAARDVLAVGLRGLGWRVEQVEAYRTEAAPIAPGARAAVASADAVTFTSASTVTHFVAAFGADAAPPVVVCIGPVTADAAVAAGLRVGATAAPHTIDGLVDAIAAVFGP
jgi:uroporphyrinogen-III synthase